MRRQCIDLLIGQHEQLWGHGRRWNVIWSDFVWGNFVWRNLVGLDILQLVGLDIFVLVLVELGRHRRWL